MLSIPRKHMSIFSTSVFHLFFKNNRSILLEIRNLITLHLCVQFHYNSCTLSKLPVFRYFTGLSKIYRKIRLLIRNLPQKLRRTWNFYQNRTIFRFSPHTLPDPKYKSWWFETLFLADCKKWKPTVFDANEKELEKKKSYCSRRCSLNNEKSAVPVRCNCDRQRNCFYEIKVRGDPGSKRKGWFPWDHRDSEGNAFIGDCEKVDTTESRVCYSTLP